MKFPTFVLLVLLFVGIPRTFVFAIDENPLNTTITIPWQIPYLRHLTT